MTPHRWALPAVSFLLLAGPARAEDDAPPPDAPDDDSGEATDEAVAPEPVAPEPVAAELAEALRQAKAAAAAAQAAQAEAERLLGEARALQSAPEEPTDGPVVAPAPPTPPELRATLFTLPGDVPVEISLNGKYALWVLNQHGFLLGQDNPLDDADYVVQMLRMKLKFGTPYFGAVARLDAGQGWWGADNSPDVQAGVATADDGTVSSIASYNTYKLFGNKDTNYTVHFDHVYAYIAPPVPFGWDITIGRQNFALGHKLVLDEDYDGIQMEVRPVPQLALSGFFAVVSEGVGSYKAPKGLLMSDDDPYQDALLAGGQVRLDLEPVTIALFGAHYWDRTDAMTGSSHLPNGVGYLRSRFRPNLSTVTAVGLTVDARLPVLQGLEIGAEGDFLVGTDAIANPDHAGALLDINDGSVSGWNVFFEIDQTVAVGPATLEPGFTFGVGSGDDDPTSGRGNTNQIATMGFFALTNVWEDSVMPDISGISPQGLGSPVSRGYRELENTVALQPRIAISPWKPLKFRVAYTYLRATQPIFGWDAATGAPTGETSQEIGHEIDVDFVAKILPNVTYKALFGAFVPSEGASLLITGSTEHRRTAWELKQVLVVGF